MWLDQRTVVASWGIVVDTYEPRTDEPNLQETLAGVLRNCDVGEWITEGNGDFFTLRWRGLDALTDTYVFGDLTYVSWTLVSRTNPLLSPKKTFSIDEINEMRAFAAVALTVVQNCVLDFYREHALQLPERSVATSGVLGELSTPLA
jgi:hypothetical protein